MDKDIIMGVKKLLKDLEQLRKDLDNHIPNTDHPHEVWRLLWIYIGGKWLKMKTQIKGIVKTECDKCGTKIVINFDIDEIKNATHK